MSLDLQHRLPGSPLSGSWAAEYLGWLAGRRLRLRVRGASMAPTLRAGDQVLLDPAAYRGRPPRSGDVVVSRHPLRSDSIMIKRVGAVRPDGKLELLGDNPGESTDSRAFGGVNVNHIVGRVTRRLP